MMPPHDPRHCPLTCEFALALAEEGIAVFPLIYGQKMPATGRGFLDATTNPFAIRRWFSGNYPRNLGARTGQASGVWVLDVDELDALDRLELEHGKLPATRCSRTSRGEHYWFRTVPIPIPSSTGRVAPGVDVRGDGSYVVAPPSVHPSGVGYGWIDNLSPIAEAPSWLLVLARRPTPPQTPPPLPDAPRACSGRYGQAALEAEIRILVNTLPGGRNHALNRAAFCLFQLVAACLLVAAEVERRLIEACERNGLVAEDGIRSVMATIRSGARAGLMHPRGRR